MTSRFVAIEFPVQVLPPGGRVTLRASLTTRGAALFKQVFVGPESLTACVLERLTVEGVDRLQVPIGTRPAAIRAEAQRVDVQLGRLVALATQPIELGIVSCHDQLQTVGAVIIGEDLSPFPRCTRAPSFVSRILGVERVACSLHATQARTLAPLEDWIAIRRRAPPELRTAGCGCLFWKADEYPPMH